MSSVRLELVDSDQLQHVWPRIQKSIRAMLKRGCGDRLDEITLFANVLVGKMRMVCAFSLEDDQLEAAIIYNVVNRPKGRAIQIVAIALNSLDHKHWSGEMNSWLIDLKGQLGCYCIEAYCRDGAARILRNYGWRRKAIVMES